MTPFREILRRAVEATPAAIGGAFADAQGEMVDCFARYDAHEWAVLTAQCGVIMGHLSAAFGTWHFGGPEFFIQRHGDMEIVVHRLTAGYFALLAVPPSTPTLAALEVLASTCRELEREIA